MYVYDFVCYIWCYDIGGFVWDNMELVFNMWLWYNFLCIGCVDIWCMVEVMICYMVEVDVYYIGLNVGLGSWYNVSYWGCGVKEVWIS